VFLYFPPSILLSCPHAPPPPQTSLILMPPVTATVSYDPLKGLLLGGSTVIPEQLVSQLRYSHSSVYEGEVLGSTE